MNTLNDVARLIGTCWIFLVSINLGFIAVCMMAEAMEDFVDETRDRGRVRRMVVLFSQLIVVSAIALGMFAFGLSCVS